MSARSPLICSAVELWYKKMLKIGSLSELTGIDTKIKVAGFQRLYSKWLWLLMAVYKPSFADAELYEEIQRGSFVEATEHERLLELRTFISRLHIKTTLLGNTVSNTVPFVGMIPNDRVRILNELDSAIKNAGEKELRRYRDSIRSL